MKKQNIQWFSSGFILLLLFILPPACRKDTREPATGQAYELKVPAGFPQPLVSAGNPLSRAGVALGRRLYYDTLLSAGGPHQGRACASCHFQDKGFTLPDAPVLAHVNLAWSRNFLWKGEISGSLEDIMVFEVKDFFQTDLSGIRSSPAYPEMYRSAFGDAEINEQKTAYALAQFIRTLISGNSSYDRFRKGSISLPADALRGYELFFSEKGDCFHCHGNALFTDNEFHNIGLRTRSSADMGRYLVTGSVSDIGKFKTPSLRNVALKNSFMHDGRFKTLEEVVNHYNSGFQKSEYLDPILDKPAQVMTPSEMSDLVAFLKTLTDTEFLYNPELSAP